MKINKLELVNFRNYKNLNLDFSSNKILIIGKNAQGKTNILESIYYTSSLKSLRAKTESELIFWGQTFASIRLNFNKSEDFDSKLELILNPPKKKLLKDNDVKKNKYSDFISQLKTVNFQVDDLLLLRGTPENRRDWLDLAISQIYSAYYDRLTKYNKIRQQKVNYLKNSKLLTFDPSLFDVYNSQISIAGSNILFLRLKFLKEIIKFAQITHNNIANSENLTIVYNSTVLGDIYIDENYDLPSINQIVDLYNQKLEEKKELELLRLQALVGVHRDDISFFINDIDSKKYASQGQQRTIVLSLKLAEVNLINNKTGYNPLLLLDDVLAELDDVRQSFLLETINQNIQTIITSVDALQFDKKYLENVQVFNINNIT